MSTAKPAAKRTKQTGATTRPKPARSGVKSAATAAREAKPRTRASSGAVVPLSAQAMPPVPPPPPFMDRGRPIPDTYGHDVLRMMARDPEWIFLYWEVTPHRMRQLQSRFANLHAKPWRVKLIDTDANIAHDSPVFLDACSWYLPVKPRTTYRAELGFMDGGLFVKVLSSNEVKTPADTVSDCGDEQWMIQRSDLMRMLHLQDEKDLFGPGRPFASVERFREVSIEEMAVLERLARQVRSVGASGNVPKKSTA